MRHLDTWLLRDPYSVSHYYPSGRRWQEIIRKMIMERQICAPRSTHEDQVPPIDPHTGPVALQSESMFLSKLPAEIRLMIYNYVFGDGVIHLVQLKGRIRHVKHDPSSTPCCTVSAARWRMQDDGDQHSQTLLYPHTHRELPGSLSNSSLSLLRTCRAIYAEAADIPYSNLTFDVDDLHTLIAFTSSVSPHLVRSIRRLTVQWTPIWQPMTSKAQSGFSLFSYTHSDELWTLFWEHVATRLDGLQDLRLCLDLGRISRNSVDGGVVGGHRLHLAADEPWVKPMLAVRGLRSFDLGITVKCDPYTRRVLEDGLKRDVVALRDQLRDVMCSAGSHGPGSMFLMDIDRDQVSTRRGRPRLAITAV